jgi:hypothetical protein
MLQENINGPFILEPLFIIRGEDFFDMKDAVLIKILYIPLNYFQNDWGKTCTNRKKPLMPE